MSSGAYWREYPVRMRGETALVVGAIAAPFGIGLIAAFGLVIAIGIPAEGGFLTTALVDVGVEREAAVEASRKVDLLGRAGVGIAALAGLLALIALATARHIADGEIGGALATAADADAPRSEVPVSWQRERVARRGVSGLKLVLVFGAGGLGFVGVVMLIYVLVEPHESSLLPLGLALVAATAAMLAVLRRLHRVVAPRRAAIGARISEHWDRDAEAVAWRTALAARASRADADRGRRHPLVRVGRVVQRAGAAGLVVVPALFHLLTILRYPDAVRISPSQWELGRPAELAGQELGLVSAGVWLFSGLIIAGVVLPATGAVLVAIGAVAERRGLRRALASEGAAHPAPEVLDHHSRRHGDPLAALLAAASGAGLAAGSALLLLSGIDDPDGFYRRAPELFAADRGTGLVIALVAAVLLLAAIAIDVRAGSTGLELRNRLLRRWPTPPGTDDDGDAPRIGAGE